MTDQFDRWKQLLMLKQQHPTRAAFHRAVIDAGLKMDSADPMSGYFRKPMSKGSPVEPIGIWREDGVLIIEHRGTRYGTEEGRLTDSLLDDIFAWSDWDPVPYEAYEAVVYDGKEWPDVHSLKEEPPLDGIEELAGRLPDPNRVDNPLAVIGHNTAAGVDEALLLSDRIDELRRGVKMYATIISDEMRDRSQSLRSDLLKLAGEADKTREGLKRPHLEACREIDGKWMPLVKAAKNGADMIRGSQEAYATLKLRQQREAEAAAEAERVRREAEAAAAAEAAQTAVDRGEPMPEPSLPLAPAPEPVCQPPATSFRGGKGRAAHMTAVIELVPPTTDEGWSQLIDYLKTTAALRESAFAIAKKVHKAGAQVPPGCAVAEAKPAQASRPRPPNPNAPAVPAAKPAEPGSSIDPARDVKGELLDLFKTWTSSAECFAFAQRIEARIEGLAPHEKTEVRKAYINRQQELVGG